MFRQILFCCRFEGVHPNIYAVYELLQNIEDLNLQNQIREHVINIEGLYHFKYKILYNMHHLIV